MLVHFTDPTHLAFDSMIYDGKTKSLILIQITINEKLKFMEINGLIKLKNEKIQKLYDKVNKKYYCFFREISDKDLVENYYFHWMTPEKLPKLNEMIENEIATLGNLKFRNKSYYDDLIDQIKMMI